MALRRSLDIEHKPFVYNILQTYQIWLDKWTPHTTSRWAFTIAVIVAFLLRIVLKQVCDTFNFLSF